MVETTEIEKRGAAQQNRLPAPLAPLERLAWNYWWSWAADGAGIFRDLDPEIWEECEHNPRQLLAKTSAYRLGKPRRIRFISNASDVWIRRFGRIWRPGPVGPSAI